MAYDANNRLTNETIADPTAGVTATAYACDDANNRNSKQVTGGSEPGQWSYNYNAANQLTSWQKQSDGSPAKSATLAYEEAGNRIAQTLQDQASGTIALTVGVFLELVAWSGEQLVVFGSSFLGSGFSSLGAQQIHRSFEADAFQFLLMCRRTLQDQRTDRIVGDGVHEQFFLDHRGAFGARCFQVHGGFHIAVELNEVRQTAEGCLEGESKRNQQLDAPAPIVQLGWI